MSNLQAEEYKNFEEIKRVREDGTEYWSARELSEVLQYKKWENFAKVIDRAKLACQNSGRDIDDDFPKVRKIVKAGALQKTVVDYELSRYACYLVVQNGDPRKEIIALGQTYFAIQTRKQDFEVFLTNAKKETYANSKIEKVNSSRIGSNDYHYEELINGRKYSYHDTYFGGTKFMGEEVVYCDSDKPIWGMNYYGVTLDKTLEEEAMDNALRPALMKVGEDKSVIPTRGPSKLKNNEYTYTFKTTGTIENFDGIEQIYKDNILIYELHCSGGIIE